MPSKSVIAILDVGKTNKKLFLFDEAYKIAWEQTAVIQETTDEDGDPCEDLNLLNTWVRESLIKSMRTGHFIIKAVNFSAYGASFVLVGEDGNPVTPLYNYLKPYPGKIKQEFYGQYGGEQAFSLLTASPVLDSLNSGLQLYRIKKEHPEKFSRIKYAMHLPQYLSWIMTGKACSDITSIGCHTSLWNFSLENYHEWVYREGIMEKLPPIKPSGTVHPVCIKKNEPSVKGISPDCLAGIGLHDSSAAMIPYLESFREPFILISTGTWCISMNPFNSEPLTIAELRQDCLCYLNFKRKPIKASRLFAGSEHEIQVERLAAHFQKDKDYYQSIEFDPGTIIHLRTTEKPAAFSHPSSMLSASVFAQRELSGFQNYEKAYHRLLMDIMDQQTVSTKLILTDEIKRIFVDGGFSRNPVYMHLLAAAFPSVEVFAASIAQASAIGAAMVIHEHWNNRRLPSDMIELKYYKS